MTAPLALASAVAAWLATVAQADPFRSLTTEDRYHVINVVLGTPTQETTSAQGIRMRTFETLASDGALAHRVYAWSDPDGVTLALRADAYRSESETGIEIGVTTVADILAMVDGRRALELAETLMLPADGQWAWRVTWPIAGVPREYLQLTFVADALPQGQPSNYVTDDAILTAVMVMSMATAEQSLDLHALNRAEQRRMGRIIRELLNE